MSMLTAEEEAEIRSLMREMSIAEKIDILSGYLDFYAGSAKMMAPGGYGSQPWVAGRNERLKVEGIKFVDGPRGIVMKGGTTFPVSIARGATFDTELEERIGEAIGKELVFLGGNTFGGVCVNLLRHPAWGRAQETFGEDTLHLSAMGSALTRGVEKYAISVVKHFALNSMENSRFRVDVKIKERALHELYLRHFRRIVTEAKSSSVMSSYNSVNGDYAGENKYLLTKTLKESWGFEGAVMTDFVFGFRNSKKAILAGQDLEMPFRQQWGYKLPQLVVSGDVPNERIDDAVLRILRIQKRKRQLVDSIDRSCHRALALEAARKSIVLLKNDGDLLPLKPDPAGRVKRIGLFGPLARVANTGDRGSSNTMPERVVTCEEGLVQEFGRTEVTFEGGGHEGRVKDLAQKSDLNIVVVGYDYRSEGEFVVPNLDAREKALFPRPKLKDIPSLLKLGWNMIKMFFSPTQQAMGVGGDRTMLTLSEEDERLIETVASVSSKVIVVVFSGSSFICESWRDKVNSILCLWYPGEMGGKALAEIVAGKVNPGGRLPAVFARSAECYPFFDSLAESIEYDYWHGYRKLEKDGVEPAFPFGFGLSYTTFTLSEPDVEVICEGKIELMKPLVNCNVTITNTGNTQGDDVIQIYMSVIDSTVSPRPIKELIAFQRVNSLQPGETRSVNISILGERFAYYDEGQHCFVVEAARYALIFARHSLDSEALTVVVALPSSE